MPNQSKIPPFGKALLDRQRFNNPPFLVAVCVGGDAWNHAKQWNRRGVNVGLVLPPDTSPKSLNWPVKGCLCVIEWGTGPAVPLIVELAKCLLMAGAESVTVRPLWVDFSQPNLEWPADQERIRTYYAPRKELAHVA
ncbi:hypothetical protein [Methylomonas sp. MK1]|uniref:hypothetical protein n=1 Tax=Methylomonas sp. MK1 TaxID=1131552 RepID=UPI0003690751|nr:hypothetical protein [Methylomonas sp. MK1]